MKTCFKTFSTILVVILVSLPLCGCWDYIDSKDINYVSGMAIDKEGDKYAVTFEILMASNDGQSLNTMYTTSKGNSIHTAIRDGISRTGSKLQLSHMKVVIVSEEIAEEGMVPILDLIDRDVEVRNDMWLLVAKSVKASNIIKGVKEESGIMSYKIANVLNKPSKTGKSISTEVFKFIDDVDTKGESPVIPLVGIEDSKEFNVEGSAVFNKDKMIGTIDEYDTQILKIIKEEDESEEFVMAIPYKDGGSIGIELMDIKRRYDTYMENGQVVINVNIDIDAALSEINSKNFKTLNKQKREEITRYVEMYLREKSSILIEELQQKYGVDVIGLGHILTRSQNKELQYMGNQWDSKFKDSKINIDPKLNIRYMGLTMEPIGAGD